MKAASACDAFLRNGGRWFAVHASNSVAGNPHLPGIIGSKFITHPPYTHFPVSVSAPQDPLVKGIEPFEVDDEIYVIEHADDIEVLLETRWGGEGIGGRQVEEGRTAADVPASGRGRQRALPGARALQSPV